MKELMQQRTKRNILSLKKEEPPVPLTHNRTTLFLKEELSVYMVWCPDADMPKKVYQADEQKKAIGHAKKLADETGRKFYVMRSWRGYEPDCAV
jgi:hypothetical protein